MTPRRLDQMHTSCNNTARCPYGDRPVVYLIALVGKPRLLRGPPRRDGGGKAGTRTRVGDRCWRRDGVRWEAPSKSYMVPSTHLRIDSAGQLGRQARAAVRPSINICH